MVKLNRKVKVASLSVASNTTLIILKVIAGILSGSVSIISEAIHSSMDLIASIIAFFAVRFSSKPADRNHPYGHGKIENISGVIEGLLIFVAALLIISEAVKKILHPAEIEETSVAIAVMFVSAIVNIIVSRRLYKVACEEDSIALEADALHLKTDVYTSIGVGVGLILIKITGNNILDPIVAILVASLIIKESWTLCKNAFCPLLDMKLSDEEEEEIIEVLKTYDEVIDISQLKTRKSGQIKYIDFHLASKPYQTVMECHELCKKIQNELELRIKYVNVNIFVVPEKSDTMLLEKVSEIN